MRIGVDIGGVLIGKGPGNHQLFEVEDSFGSLETLSKKHSLYIISYCGQKRAELSYRLLEGICLVKSQYYVSKKEFKSSIINYLGCDIMIDDRENILDHIKSENPGVVTILFQAYNKQKKTNHRWHKVADNWAKVLEIIDGLEWTKTKTIERPQGNYFITS